MKTIYIIHGWSGSPEDDWLGWAVQTFRDKGYNVIAPEMPDTDHPKIEPWVQHLKSVVTSLDQDTYFIGHSIGCQTIMRFLETVEVKVGGAIFVAGWFNLINLENEESEKIAEPWIKTPINTDKVHNNLRYSVAMLGDNDPWVPYKETKEDFETKLHSEIVTVQGGGHITSDDGFGPIPQLIDIFESHL